MNEERKGQCIFFPADPQDVRWLPVKKEMKRELGRKKGHCIFFLWVVEERKEKNSSLFSGGEFLLPFFGRWGVIDSGRISQGRNTLNYNNTAAHFYTDWNKYMHIYTFILLESETVSFHSWLPSFEPIEPIVVGKTSLLSFSPCPTIQCGAAAFFSSEKPLKIKLNTWKTRLLFRSEYKIRIVFSFIAVINVYFIISTYKFSCYEVNCKEYVDKYKIRSSVFRC